MRDARGSAVAALTWVLWKGRNRLQNLEAPSRNFSGPTSFKLFGKKTFGGTPAYRFMIYGTLDFFWKNLARLKLPLLPDLLQQLLLKLLLLSRSAHSNAVRLKIPHPLRTARVPTIILPSRGFNCCCICQPSQGYHPPCVLLRLHHRKVPTMVVQQPSMLHRRWAAISAHRTLLVPRLG